MRQPTVRHLQGFRPFLLAASMILAGSGLFAQQEEVNGCSRIQVQNPPTFVSSVTWAQELQKFVLVDSLGGKVFEADLAGSVVEQPSDGGLILLEDSGGEFLGATQRLENGRRRIKMQWRDPQLRVLSEWDLSGDSSLFPYEQELASDSLVLFGSRFDSPTPATGMFVVSVESKLAQSPQSQPSNLILNLAHDYYTLGWSLIATHGRLAYFLALEPKRFPALYRYDGAAGASPAILGNLPFSSVAMPDLGLTGPGFNMDGFPAVFKEIEDFKDLPVGLFSKRGYLYLLTRRQKGEKTVWKMTKLHPGYEEVVALGTVTLPTWAAHLLMVQLPKSVVLFELGPVGFENGGLTQTLEALISVPEDWIKNPPLSPLGLGDVEPAICRTIPLGRAM